MNKIIYKVAVSFKFKDAKSNDIKECPMMVFPKEYASSEEAMNYINIGGPEIFKKITGLGFKNLRGSIMCQALQLRRRMTEFERLDRIGALMQIAETELR